MLARCLSSMNTGMYIRRLPDDSCPCGKVSNRTGPVGRVADRFGAFERLVRTEAAREGRASLASSSFRSEVPSILPVDGAPRLAVPAILQFKIMDGILNFNL